MRIEIAVNAGRCYGINRALDLAAQAVQKGGGGPVATLGPLLHNPQQVERLREMGVGIIGSVDEARGGTVIIRSHGVSPCELERLSASGVRVVDATCPHVKRIHQRVLECGRAGQAVVILGEKNHPEVIATKAWAGADAYVVENEGDIEALPPLDAACAVVQTTLPESTFESLTAALRKRIPSLTVHNTICEATRKRQDAAMELAGRMDAMLVIGGRNSANTQKLAQLSGERCERTYLIETAADIPWTALRFDDSIGITAGASTPDWIIKEVITAMNDHIENRDGQDTAQDVVLEEAQSVPASVTTASEPAAMEAQPAPVSEEDAPAVTEPQAAPEPPAQDDEPQETPAPSKDDDFMEAYEKTLVSIKQGQTIQGVVVQVTADEVCVNIGYKSDGIIKRADLASDGDPTEAYKVGDTVDAEVVKVNDGEGNVLLSQRNVIARKNWDLIAAKHEAGEYVEGVGREAVKGGLVATVMGVRAFIPASQMSERYVERIDQFVGQDMTLKIIELDERKRRIVASRKQVILEQMAKVKEEVWSRINEGDVIKGIVRRLTDFGAFVDIGGVDGLVHVTDLSWGRVAHPSDVVKIGEEIDVTVLRLDREKEHISLGYKQLKPKPWDTAVDKYPVNSIVQGKVMRIVTFGAFVELEPGLDGLVHISQVSDTRIGKVEDVLNIGDIVNVKVLDVNPESKRISLSVRDAMVYDEQQYGDEYAADDAGYDAPEAPLNEQPAEDGAEEAEAGE